MANEWFKELNRVYALLPDYDSAYTQLGRLYVQFLDEATLDSKVLLAGYFAKTDYLLKEKQAQQDLRRMVNEMRLRLTKHKTTQSHENFLRDFQALCLFVSLSLDENVPDDLSCKFPSCDYKCTSALFQEDYIRVIVNSWDNEFVLCNGELGSENIYVKYSGEGQLFDTDHSYIGSLLEPGMMLNVIRPRRRDDGVLLPEFIILEPDFLIDISTISSCFESYAESPLISLVKRLTPDALTEPILMGNMAGELLDTLVHEPDIDACTADMLKVKYRQAALKFFRKNAVGIMAVCPSGSFHTQAWNQMLNIREAFNSGLSSLLARFDRNTIIVEPSFFSEMLGLQGRMDMLQADMRVLVEQKAGKAAFPSSVSDADTPRYKEQHYIQMLLYMAIIRYNYRQKYDDNNKELHAFLLYSKYRLPLVGLGFAPDLLFRALRLRNQYVAQEKGLCAGSISKLMTMNADDFNENGVNGKLWHQYQRPQIAALLKSLQEASECEQAYFERFYRFVALEHRLSKIGSQSKENSGFASAWLSSLEDKLQCGNILLNLEIDCSAISDVKHIEQITMRFSGDSGNFRQGDIVILYPYESGTIPDLRYSMVLRATILRIAPTEITLQMRAAQNAAGIFGMWKHMPWCLEHDFLESSYNSLYKGLYSFICAPKDRRDLFLLQRSPEVVKNKSLSGNYGEFNSLQQRVKDAKELFLIIGPPGTGKTSFGLLNTLQEELLNNESKVLLVSYTNRSVDEICSKLYEEIDFIRIGGGVVSQEMYADKVLGNIVAQSSSVSELKQRFLDARVVVGTVSSVVAHQSVLAMTRFSLCIVDEASQLLEPHLLPLLSLCCKDGYPCISKFVMIGDHKQLPAVVQQRSSESRVEDAVLHSIGLTDCRKSMFERLLSRYRHNPEVCFMLTRQGRMHRDIAHFPNVAFYGGLLREVPLNHQLLDSPSARVRFIDVSPSENVIFDKMNVAEADVIVSELRNIWEQNKKSFDVEKTVGVIVPYRNQISAIRSALADQFPSDHPLLQITIDTVERYQGSQRRYIIYGFTVQKLYQLRFLTETTFEEDGLLIDRKLNVAMTRAQEYLILVGNSTLLSHVPLYARLLKYVSCCVY